MSFRIVYTPLFLKDVEDQVDYLLSRGAPVQTISTWYDKLFERLEGLDEMPKRLPVDERMSELTGMLTRKFIYGNYFAFYRVLEDKQCVELLHFQHGARERERYARQAD